MASTNFKVFNEAMDTDRTFSDSEYAVATQRDVGVIPGMANSRLHNKMYRQSTAMPKAIADFLVSQGYDVMDNDIPGITENIEKAITTLIKNKTTEDLDEHNTNKDAHASGIKGNAASATKLQTARKINGVNFDGTADITITDDTKSPATHTHNYAGSSSAGGVANSAKDSDTVDGKHATDFAPSGFGLGGEVCLLNSGSANDLINTGFFNATPSVTDLPKTGCYYYIIVMRHKSVNPSADTTKVTKQIAYSLQPAKDGTNIYERTQFEGVWTSWKQIATTEFVKNELDKFNFTIIYPNGGSKNSPANVVNNTRYVMDNPFPGYYVACEVEIQVNGVWGNSGIANGMKDGFWTSYGVAAKQFNSADIVVQTGSAGVTGGTSNIMMDEFGINVQNILTSAPCRVKVWKVGKIS